MHRAIWLPERGLKAPIPPAAHPRARQDGVAGCCLAVMAIPVSDGHELAPAASFERFFLDWYPSVVGTVGLLTGSRAEAEDLAQEAFLRVFERWGRVSTMESPSGYVLRVALNLRKNLLRRMFRAPRRAPDPPAVDAIDTIAERYAVRREVLRLPLRQREVLVLSEFLDLSDREISELVGCSPGAVRDRLLRGRKALRRALEDQR